MARKKAKPTPADSRHPLALGGSDHVEDRFALCADPEPVTTKAGLVELIADLRIHFDHRRGRQAGQPIDDHVLAHLLAPMQNAHGVKDADHVWGFPVVDWSKLPSGWPNPDGDAVASLRRILAWAESKVVEQPPQGKVDGPWSKPDSPRRWAIVFGISAKTFVRKAKSGEISTHKLSDRSYQVALSAIPADHK